MRVETLFWIAVVVLSCLFLLYQHLDRRRLNRTLGKLPEIYDAARAEFLSGSRASAHSKRPRHAMLGTLETISETTGGGGPPPAFADLTKREMRFVELLHATTCMNDREFKRTLTRLSKQEQKTFQQLRDIYGGPPPRRSYARRMIDRVARYRRVRRQAKLDAEAKRASDARWAAEYYFWEIPDILQWLRTEAPRDPDLWHLLPGLNWDYEELYDVLLWVVTQPECDAATAILILHLMAPDVAMDIASGGTQWCEPGDKRAESTEVKLLAMIGVRSEDSSFVRHELAPDWLCTTESNAGLLDMMLSKKERIEASGRNVPFPLPVKLLSTPVPATGRTPATRYETHDDRLLLAKSDNLQAV
ncbi:DUF4274 domain-containing protein [Ensifer adhaerens]|uniref:DUF4274 domain-containing protein n=1 Tax=Ensifer adhaerens TaxID=106592 RepID=UPI001CBDC017|nr:DUF4274 domain-containing protein [Ensifer adhaerens]MBZ7921988.1 DUF4274 domain-containing protein [Ensifer adhaerens]UAX94380.1 DUF4274 domain-containing protein [Ensifer adhaerens]UAY02015.1 DUF4274 domain-containing protein [Ensifer adhaerens]UAY09398.1 DUF4274 domain-containing protein [Ensifer adhaerens]